LNQDFHGRLWSLIGRDLALCQPVGENEAQNQRLIGNPEHGGKQMLDMFPIA